MKRLRLARIGAHRTSGRTVSGGVLRLLAGAAVLIVAGCSSHLPVVETAPAAKPKKVAALEKLKAKYRRPATLPIAPPDNPVTAASVDLGKQLFFSPELSLRRTVSCESCHQPNAAWADHRPKPVADNGVEMPRRSPTLVDVAWQGAFMWDGRHNSLEAMVPGPIASPSIMALPTDAMVGRLSAHPELSDAFARAYPGEKISAEHAIKALAGFMRTIRSPVTRFDRWVKGDDNALSPQEIRGFILFNGKAQCATCHSGWRFTDDGFRDIGLPATSDSGRGNVLPTVESMANAFKTPSLRSVADRAPYMHDGSLATLEAVIEHYNAPPIRRPSLSPDIVSLGLTAKEKQDLIAFLKTLSGPKISLQTKGAAAPASNRTAEAQKQ